MFSLVDDGPVRSRGVFPGFSVAVNFPGVQAVICISGDIDLCTAQALAALVDATADLEPRDLVFDLTHTTFLGAAGLHIIENTAHRQAAAGHALVVRAPSDLVRRLLEMTGIADYVHIEQRARPGPHASAQSIDVRERRGRPVLADRL